MRNVVMGRKSIPNILRPCTIRISGNCFQDTIRQALCRLKCTMMVNIAGDLFS
jgi:hypothetical protein